MAAFPLVDVYFKRGFWYQTAKHECPRSDCDISQRLIMARQVNLMTILTMVRAKAKNVIPQRDTMVSATFRINRHLTASAGSFKGKRFIEKGDSLKGFTKTGRTHLMDCLLPVSDWDQTFHAWAAQLQDTYRQPSCIRK